MSDQVAKKLQYRYRSAFITINNFTEDDIQLLDKIDYNYMMIAYHVGKKSGLPHIHICVHFKKRILGTELKSFVPRGNILPLRGTAEQCRTYFEKGGDIVFEDGVVPVQGRRRDIDMIREMVEDGSTYKEIIRQGANYQQLKYAEKVLDYMERERDFKTISFWISGPTGVGKSRISMAIASYLGDTYYCKGNLKWWNKYDAQDCSVIEEFRNGKMPFDELLRLTDRYPFSVEFKGGYREFLSKYLFITTPLSISDTFPSNDEDIKQLKRRVIEINFQ